MSNNNGTGLPALDDLNQAGKRIQQLVEKIEAMPDSEARTMLQDCLESVLTRPDLADHREDGRRG
jgi:hypothetical protein